MTECTFAFNTKGKNTILMDERALALRINNLILNRKTGLPNNDYVFFDIKERMQEFASDGNISALKEEILSHIKQFFPSDTYVDIDISKGTDKNELRQTLYFTITVGNDNSAVSMIFKGNSTSDGLKLDRVMSL